MALNMPWAQAPDYLGSVISPPSSSALNNGSMGYPTVPTPSAYVPGSLNLPWMDSVGSSVAGGSPTMPIQVNAPSWAPTLASSAGMSDMSSYLRTPTGMDSVPTYNFGGTNGQPGLLSNVTGLETPVGLDSGMFSVASQPTTSWFSGLGDWASKNKELITGGVGLAQAGLGAFNAWNTNQTAKDQLKFQKDSFSKQYEAQKGLTNSQLSDRQAQRVREHPDTATSVNDYMKQYGVK